MFFRSSNPTLGPGVFANARNYGVGESMTIQGTINKSFVLLFLIIISAGWIWQKFAQPINPWATDQQIYEQVSKLMGIGFIGGIAGLILAIIMRFNLKSSTYLAPVYAICEGVFLAGISARYEMMYPGLVMQAIVLTFATLFCLLAGYRSGIIKVTEKFKSIVFSAVMAIIALYVLQMFLFWFKIEIPYIFGANPIGIGFSILVVAVASGVLVINFDMINQMSYQGGPKFMEWYCAFSLMAALVWLYVEILILLAKLRGGRR